MAQCSRSCPQVTSSSRLRVTPFSLGAVPSRKHSRGSGYPSDRPARRWPIRRSAVHFPFDEAPAGVGAGRASAFALVAVVSAAAHRAPARDERGSVRATAGITPAFDSKATARPAGAPAVHAPLRCKERSSQPVATASHRCSRQAGVDRPGRPCCRRPPGTVAESTHHDAPVPGLRAARWCVGCTAARYAVAFCARSMSRMRRADGMAADIVQVVVLENLWQGWGTLP
jgi:hypothetical protein